MEVLLKYFHVLTLCSPLRVVRRAYRGDNLFKIISKSLVKFGEIVMCFSGGVYQ